MKKSEELALLSLPVGFPRHPYILYSFSFIRENEREKGETRKRQDSGVPECIWKDN